MTTYGGGTAVKSGYYLNLSRWHLEPVENDGGKLPAGKGEWLRVNTVAALALVPVLGGLFLMFLPFIGFALAIQAAAMPVVRLFKTSAGDLASTMTPGWRPGEAHFTGKSTENGSVDAQAPPATSRLEELEREIEAKRNGSKQA
jgi:hypothetical protein